jgi:hypothetical protein
MLADGKRCVDHIPSSWNHELELNNKEMFGARVLSLAAKPESVHRQITERREILEQSEIDKLIFEANEQHEKT